MNHRSTAGYGYVAEFVAGVCYVTLYQIVSIFIQIPKYQPNQRRRSLKELVRTNPRARSEVQKGNSNVQTVRQVEMFAGSHTVSPLRNTRERILQLDGEELIMYNVTSLFMSQFNRRAADSNALKDWMPENMEFFSPDD